MTIMIVLAVLLALLLVGAALLCAGIIGRRTDDHPVCRRCGFDLVGSVLAPESVCPECGGGVGTKALRRTGNRQRRRGMMLTGAGLIVSALLILVPTAVLPLLSQPTSKPTWWLLVEAELGTDELRQAAARELYTRHTIGKLEAEDAKRLITIAAEVHANKAQPWTNTWDSCMRDGTLFAMLSDEQRERAAVQGVEPWLKVRPKVRSGKETVVPCEIGVSFDPRVLLMDTGSVAVRGMHWRIEDKGGRVVATGEKQFERFNLRLLNPRGASHSTTHQLTCALEPGRYSLVMELDAVVALTSTLKAEYKGAPPRIAGPKVAASFRCEIEALPAGQSSVEVVDHPALLEALNAVTTVKPGATIRQPTPIDATRVRGGELYIQVSTKWTLWHTQRNPLGLTALWEYSLWHLDGSGMVPGAIAANSASMDFDNNTTAGLYFNISDRIEPGRYTLRFLPGVEAAERDSEVTRLLGGEMKLEVEIQE
jgi:hypothetical protein